jgi:hypothetical protein
VTRTMPHHRRIFESTYQAASIHVLLNGVCTLWSALRYNFAVLSACIFLSACTVGHSIATIPEKEKADSVPSYGPMTCSPSGAGYTCKTPTKELDEGTFDGDTIPLAFSPPAGYSLVGNAKPVVLGGREVFDIQVLSWKPTNIICQWHCEGSNQVFGPGDI